MILGCLYEVAHHDPDEVILDRLLCETLLPSASAVGQGRGFSNRRDADREILRREDRTQGETNGVLLK